MTLVVLIAVVVSLSGPSPRDAIEQARSAYVQHDLPSFEKYVDVDHVVENACDQLVEHEIETGNYSPLERAGINVAFNLAKPSFLPEMTQAVRQLFVNGTWSDQPQNQGLDGTTGSILSSVAGGLRGLVISQLTYRGITSVTQSDSAATVNVAITEPLSSNPLTVTFQLQKSGNHFRIIGIRDVVGLLQRISHG